MSDIVRELARARSALDQPTLRLLRKKWAPLAVAIFSTKFLDGDSIDTNVMHSYVGLVLDEAASIGEPVPVEDARALCRAWVSEQWLRLSQQDEQEQYSLTSYARNAVDYCRRIERDGTSLSESGIATIVDALRRLGTDANPDRDARITSLDTQIERLTVERERLASGGAIVESDPDRLIESYLNFTRLVGSVPADFLRLIESMKLVHRDILAAFRDETMTTGNVVRTYLEKADGLMAETAEGRAFDGALELLRDDSLLQEMYGHITAILEHPFADVLTTSERREFRSTVSMIRRSMNGINNERTRLAATIRGYVERHDMATDREVDAALRRGQQALVDWMEHSGPRSSVDVDVVLPRLALGNIATRFYDPADAVNPPPLRDTQSAVPRTMNQLRAMGGPDLPRLREHVDDYFDRHDVDEVTVADAFASGPHSARRPVDLLGYLLLAGRERDVDTENIEVMIDSFVTRRPDGTRRTLATERAVLKRSADRTPTDGDDS